METKLLFLERAPNPDDDAIFRTSFYFPKPDHIGPVPNVGHLVVLGGTPYEVVEVRHLYDNTTNRHDISLILTQLGVKS